MDNFASIISDNGTISIFSDGKNYIVETDHLNYDKIIEAIKAEDKETAVALSNIKKAVKTFFGGGCDIRDGQIFYKGEIISNQLTNRILDMMEQGFNVNPLLRFVENLMENPSAQSIKELYDFLQHKNLPITEDGCFLAYKGVRADGYDKYSGKILNEVGKVVEFPRNAVDDDRRNECSFGLHVGTIDYVRSYCTEKVLVVKINPKDCVSVPLDHDAQKLRVCKYEVISLYEGDLCEAAVYNSDGSPATPMPTDKDYFDSTYGDNYEDYSYDYDDDDDEDDEEIEYEINEDDLVYGDSCTDTFSDTNDPIAWSNNGFKYYSKRDKLGRFVK